MDYDVVVSAGCSFMHGDAIVDEKDNTIGLNFVAAKVLSEKLNCDADVIANSGFSNDRILRTIYEWVEGNTKYKRPLFLIGTTATNRIEFYNEESKKYWDLQPQHILNYTKKGLEKINDKVTLGVGNSNELKNWLVYYMKNIYSEELLHKRLQRNIIWMSEYLKNRNCDYFIHNSLEDGLEEIKSKINYVSFLDENYNGPDTWVKYLQWQMKYVDNEDINKPELYRSPKSPHGKRFCLGHPSPNANKELAERIYRKLNK